MVRRRPQKEVEAGSSDTTEEDAGGEAFPPPDGVDCERNPLRQVWPPGQRRPILSIDSRQIERPACFHLFPGSLSAHVYLKKPCSDRVVEIRPAHSRPGRLTSRTPAETVKALVNLRAMPTAP